MELTEFQQCFVTYEKHGVVFKYPDVWELIEQQDDDDVLLTVAADDSCFWTLRILPQGPPPPQVVDSCVEAFRDEYEEVDIEQEELLLGEMPA